MQGNYNRQSERRRWKKYNLCEPGNRFGKGRAKVNVMSWETIMRQYVNEMRQSYDYILIDTMPSLGMMTINALVAADSVLIPGGCILVREGTSTVN